MSRQEILAGETGLVVRTKLNENFEELYDFTETTKRGWGYQDFDAGVINSTSVTLTANENGSGIVFDSSKVVGNSAAICLVSNNLNIPYTGTVTWLSSKVGVTTNTTSSVTLSGVPHISYGACRIFYLYDYVNKLPTGNILAPKFISSQVLTSLDISFVSEEEFASKIQRYKETLTKGTHTITIPYAYANTDYYVDGKGYNPSTLDDVGITIFRNTKTVSSFNVYVDANCTFEGFTI